MAKRHVIQYFLELENTYEEMKDTVKELQEMAVKGNLEESTFLEAKKDLEVIQSNYERVAYIMFLLNKPNKQEKESAEEDVNKQWYDYLKFSSKEAIVDESKDALSHLKELIKEAQKDDSNGIC